jgi:glycosyltransferase involved in cell wall biosynthesis
MEYKKVTLISTVFNEEEYIAKLLESILQQSVMPLEVIFVDGGSTDHTMTSIKSFKPIFKKRNVALKLLEKSGNRSVGRNFAISQARFQNIASCDAGCILEKDWLKNISEPLNDSSIDVVAGFYKGLPENIFQKSLVPYVLVMEDKVNPETFLPASRTMAFRKKIWKELGGFPEGYSHNEDYVFAKQLKKIQAKLYFQKDALVYWLPRKNIKEAFTMFYRFALGDAESGIIRPKVLFIFLRYLLGLLLIFLFFYTRAPLFLSILLIGFLFYLLWAVGKNYRYVRNSRAFFYLPLLQLVSDIAVLVGTVYGLMIHIWVTEKKHLKA